MRTGLLESTLLCLCLLLLPVQTSDYTQIVQTSPPSSTVTLSKQQLDQLVTEVGNAVIRKLADKPVVQTPGSHPPAALPEKLASTLEQDLGAGTSRLFHHLVAVVTALLQLPQVFSNTFDQLDEVNSGGRDAGDLLLLVLFNAGTAIFLQFVVIKFRQSDLGQAFSGRDCLFGRGRRLPSPAR